MNIMPGVVKLHTNFWKSDILKKSWIDPSGKGECRPFWAWGNTFTENPKYSWKEY